MNVINYHVTEACNYNCGYCFGKFSGQREFTEKDACTVVKKIAEYFREFGIKNGRINISGGEPMLYPHLNQLIDFICSLGIEASVITNGSLLTPEIIREWTGKVSVVGISIDSRTDKTNRKIGRCEGGKIITAEHLSNIADALHANGIGIKVNTVVSKFNCEEDLTALYSLLRPEKIKFLQMHIVSGINDNAKPCAVSKEEFGIFCDKHKKCAGIIVSESCGDMENSYPLINPYGYFELNDKGEYKNMGDCLKENLVDILARSPLDFMKFANRYKRCAL